jgi:alpha-galactosidase
VLLQNRLITIVGPDGKETTVKQDSITNDEFAVNAAYTMASGGMVLSGDDVSGLRKENIELLRRLLPPTQVAAEFEDDTFTVGKAKINDEKAIIYIFNYEDKEKEIIASIDGKAEVFDLFENKSLGIFDGEIRFNSFKPHFAKTLICKKI